MRSNLAQRVAFAAVAIPAALGVVWYGGWVLTALVALVGVLGLRELFRFARQQGIGALGGVAYPLALLLPLAAWLVVGPAGADAGLALYAAPLALLLVFLAGLAARRPDQRPLASVAVTLFGVAYAAGLPAFLIVIRHGEGRPLMSWPAVWLTMFPLVLTWACDTAAMFAGKLIGGPRLAPTVSPGKTWAGTIAGSLAAVAVAPAYAALALLPGGVVLPLWQVGLFALLVSVVGQAGDLAESLLKREVGVKDSSHLIPGHGGVLDRFDSLYFVLPVAAALYRAFGLL
ncbi:MAG TPA: phosphatidate cytidylyltransferase [Gemmatimonadales bacterium]|jgi:phosphatidate cytidylyltransferase|nr:phosphatidate cytidylyltransferase [Gemmatimonadales bacterium]